MSEKVIKYLGIDWGEKRIGLALADSETRIATPYKVVNNLDELIAVIKHENPDRLVLGLPIAMSGLETKRLSLDIFIASLKSRTDKPIEFADERLTSKAADALVGGKKTKAPRDAVAAMIILQSYLDKIRSECPE
jgi:putative Holliday junction resolvase